MSELPPLPETDDPFELLGVTAGETSARELRRAYVKLIKVYKPERDAQAFQRIQAAYDVAKDSLDSGFAPPLSDSFPARPDAANDAANDARASADAETDAEADTEADADRAARLRSTGDAELVQMLASADPVGEALLDAIDWTRLLRIVADDAVTWEALRQQPAPWAAAALLDFRMIALLLDDRVDQALDEATAELLVRDAIDNELLEGVILRALCGGVWRQPDKARAAHQRAFGDGVDHHLTALFGEAAALADDWQHICSQADCPAALARFVERAWAVPAAARMQILEGIGTMTPVERGQAWTVLELAGERSDRLADYLYELLFAHSSGEGDRDKALSLFQVLEEHLKRGGGQVRTGSSGAPLVVAGMASVIATALIAGAWAGTAAGVIALSVVIYRMSGDVVGGVTNVRAMLRDIVDATGIKFEHLAVLAEERESRSFFGTLKDYDQTMDLFAALSRIRLAHPPAASDEAESS